VAVVEGSGTVTAGRLGEGGVASVGTAGTVAGGSETVGVGTSGTVSLAAASFDAVVTACCGEVVGAWAEEGSAAGAWVARART